ncbi:tyrosine-type recombinase/integrase [Azospirillum brasilense]|uniref:tyrosine-type recombinase/integrase n=1 Tax=Azospirillum brasilense TaxID=192 RepID=UPI001EDC2B12|nr:site-specific integrase [Azospirillum brasilense]UKJ74482.1 site-specific integrase [Azospirillum brasilense]
MASVRKREWTHNGESKTAWVVAYTDQKGKRRLITCKSKKEADKERLRVEVEIENGQHTPATETVSVHYAIEEWLKDCEGRAAVKSRLTKASSEHYKYCSRRIDAEIGSKLLTSVNGQMLQLMVNDLVLKFKPKTVRNTMMAMTLLFDFAIERGWVKRHPVRDEKIHMPPWGSPKPAIPSKEDIARLIGATEIRPPGESDLKFMTGRAAFYLAVLGGMRRGEVCALQWENVDWQRGVITVRHNLARLDGLKEPKTRAGNRVIPMSPPLRKALEELRDLKGGKPVGHVLTTKTGHHMGLSLLREDYWVPLVKRAGLCDTAGRPRYRFHALRHAAASLLIEKGLSPLHVKTVIGHASVKTTMDIYGHLFPEDDAIRRATALIAEDLAATRARQEGVSD